MLRLLYTQWKSPLYLLDRKLGRRHSWSGCGDKEKKYLLCSIQEFWGDFGSSVVFSKMENQGLKYHILHRQTRYLIFKVFNNLEHNIKNGMSTHDVAKLQEHTADAHRTILRMVEVKQNS